MFATSHIKPATKSLWIASNYFYSGLQLSKGYSQFGCGLSCSNYSLLENNVMPRKKSSAILCKQNKKNNLSEKENSCKICPWEQCICYAGLIYSYSNCIDLTEEWFLPVSVTLCQVRALTGEEDATDLNSSILSQHVSLCITPYMLYLICYFGRAYSCC